MLIYRMILWACDKAIRVNRKTVNPVYRLDDWATRKIVPAVPVATAGDVYDWAKPGNWPAHEICPVCFSAEFPLTPYDGIRMCMPCKDEAIITDKAIPSTITRRVA